MVITKDYRPYRVLVVDDLEHQRVAIKTAIGAIGPKCKFEFAEASEPKEAEDVLKSELLPFDLVVIDFKLLSKGAQDNSVEELATFLNIIKQVFRRHSQTRVIVYTAYPALESACAAYEAGANSYISKLDPDSTKKLQKKSKELLQQLEIRDALRCQHKAQREAEEEFAKNRKKWIKMYGGKLVLVRNGRVIANETDPEKLWNALGRYPTEQRYKMGIIEVPLQG